MEDSKKQLLPYLTQEQIKQLNKIIELGGGAEILSEMVESLQKVDLVKNEKSGKQEIKKRDIEKAFIRMLGRIGGGFKFTGWIDSTEGKAGERSDLSKQTDVDWCLALYGSDFKKKSHFVGYVGVIRFEGKLRITAEIDYFDDIGSDIEPFVGTAEGKTIASESSRNNLIKGFHHKGSAEAMKMLYELIERFNKNIGQL